MMTDPFHLPIRRLTPNLPGAFEAADYGNLPLIRRAVDAGLVVPSIDYTIDGKAVWYPRAGLDTRIITVQETHLAALWAFCYGLFVVFERGVQAPMVAGAPNLAELDMADGVIVRAASGILWARSLATEFSSWPPELPTPDGSADFIEDAYALKANALFVDAVVGLLWHEFAHLSLRHFKSGSAAVDLELEKDADDVAFHALVAQGDGEDVRARKGWALVVPLLANILSAATPHQLRAKRHPDVDHRLASVLGKLNFTRQMNRDYYYGLSAYALSIALRGWGTEVADDGPFETTEDAFNKCLDHVDRLTCR